MRLKAMKTNNMLISRITHEAAAQLELQQESNWAYQIDLRNGRGKNKNILFAKGVEVLKCLEPGAGSEPGQQNPGPRLPDVIIGWKDWEWMRGYCLAT
jgi:hypothetical protein